MKNKKGLHEEDFNLSDNALFLSVMKNEGEFRTVLSIILGKTIVKLKDIKVENVILNEEGKRGIRLDAWAVEEDGTQYNCEMQRDSNYDHIPKRSRFYQSLIDSPILKSGSKTRYKELPKTYIIFITEEDIFKQDRACYTFQNYCKEDRLLELEDEAIKIFLNMESKNGDPDMVSLLQYMKKTTLDNPDIIIQDSKLKYLDEVVTEVKQSEEWEELTMTILERGKEIGKEIGESEKQIKLIILNYKKGISLGAIADFLDIKQEYVEDVISLWEETPNITLEEIYQKVNI